MALAQSSNTYPYTPTHSRNQTSFRSDNRPFIAIWWSINVNPTLSFSSNVLRCSSSKIGRPLHYDLAATNLVTDTRSWRHSIHCDTPTIPCAVQCNTMMHLITGNSLRHTCVPADGHFELRWAALLCALSLRYSVGHGHTVAHHARLK